MGVEHRVYGGPGCGKTTYLAEQIARAVRKYGPAGVLVCSFSRAAASELVGRGLPVPRERVGTLHSLCRRALGGDREIAEASEKLAEWNDAAADGGWYVKPSTYVKRSDDASPDGDLFTAYGILRNQMVLRDHWPADVLAFATAWEAWKSAQELIDFCDLIEFVWLDRIPCPYRTEVLFADEAQDYSALEMAVVRQWGREARFFVIAGDDQQAIYGFRGASSDAMMTPELEPSQVTILKQSYRLPSEILAYASEYGRTMSRFVPKDIQPVKQGGDVMALDVRLRDSQFVDHVQAEAGAGRSVMILASCDYMLTPIVRSLKEEAVLFHNPYRPTYSAWNPCRGGVERVRQFLQVGNSPKWRTVWPWFEHLDARATGMQSGAKKLVRDASSEDGNETVTPEDFRALTGFDLPDPDPEWFFDRLLQTKLSMFGYAKTVIDSKGWDYLSEKPKVIVGTYHSVKGGEADVVFMFPDLSRNGADEYARNPDSTTRMFYVGMTRARERLVVCSPSSALHPGLPTRGIYVEPVTS